MRVLVINGSRARLPDPVYPLGAAIIATTIERAGHQVSWFDALHHKDPEDALKKQINQSSPQVILMSIRNIDSSAFPSPVHYFDDHHSLAKVCRQQSKAPIVLGGSGFSLMPDEFMTLLGAQIGVVGDGETAIVSLLEDLENGRKETTGVVHAQKNSSDNFVAANRDFFDSDWYYLHGGVANLQTKRGCPLNCIYCTYPLLEGSKPRMAQARAIVDEIEEIKSRGISHFFFVDAVFNGPETHAAVICEELIRRETDISFAAYLAPRASSDEFPLLLKRAGCTAAELGTDALNDKMLSSYKKGFNVDDVMRFSRALKEQGIPQCHNLILGGPGETDETMEESIARLDEIDPNAVILTIGLRVYPHTELAKIASDCGDELTGKQLEPVFFIEPNVADTIVEKSTAWLEDREGWICPGLGKRYNPRYLARLRMHRQRKGVLWPMF
jgi:radical SAM superfamily enzyme YgiQ (UPF0313 family)